MSASFCTAEVIVGDSTMNVLSCVDTWREWTLPLFLALWRLLGDSALSVAVQVLGVLLGLEKSLLK